MFSPEWQNAIQRSDLTKVKKSWKMGSGPGSPFGLEDKAPWASWMFNCGGFTDSPHLHKQEARGLDTIQATSFLVATCTSFKTILKQRKICKKSWNQEKSWEIISLKISWNFHRLVSSFKVCKIADIFAKCLLHYSFSYMYMYVH